MERKEIKFRWGWDIDDCYNLLKEYKEKDSSYIYFGDFNTREINSEMTLDEMYMLILGRTKEEHDKRQAEFMKRIKEEEKQFELEKPQVIERLKQSSIGLIPENRLDEWNSLIESSVNDGIYRGDEISCTLELIKLFKENKDFECIKQKFEEQSHSGTTANIAFILLEEFCERGDELVNYIKRKIDVKNF